MFQKRNDFEIVALLQKESLHLRSIAKSLAIPLSTAMRATHFLTSENVIDYKKQGRNKEFFLKETNERRIYEYMAEKYKLLKLLQKPVLRRYVQQILSQTNNELVILFGSYAKGAENEQSDIDVYVETKDASMKSTIGSISEKISVKIGSFEKSSDIGREIIKDHVVLQNLDRYFYLII